MIKITATNHFKERIWERLGLQRNEETQKIILGDILDNKKQLKKVSGQENTYTIIGFFGNYIIKNGNLITFFLKRQDLIGKKERTKWIEMRKKGLRFQALNREQREKFFSVFDIGLDL